MWRTGEVWPGRWITDYQFRSNALWSGGLRADEPAYKDALYQQTRPQIIILGSSRVLQFRAGMFSESFLNMGRGIEYETLFESYKHLTRTHRPKTVIWGLDYFLFAQSRCRNVVAYRDREERAAGIQLEGRIGLEVVPSNLFTLWTRLMAGQFSITDLFKALLLDGAYKGSRIGLRASLSNSGGYIRDGSYLYLAEHARPSTTQEKLQKRLSSLTKTKSVYALRRNDTLCQQQMSAFQQTIDHMQRDDTTLVLFFPPLPRRHAAVLMRDPAFSDYYEAVRSFVADAAERDGIVFVNALDLTFSDSEFFDSIHPGETISARLLRDFASHPQFDQTILNKSKVNRIIDRCSGMATCGEYYSEYGVTRLETIPAGTALQQPQ